MTAIELDLPWPYICDGCMEEVDPPITEHQWNKAKNSRGRFLCERCLEKKLSKATKPSRVETSSTATGRRGGGNSDGLRTTSEPPRPTRT